MDADDYGRRAKLAYETYMVEAVIEARTWEELSAHERNAWHAVAVALYEDITRQSPACPKCGSTERIFVDDTIPNCKGCGESRPEEKLP